MNKRVVHFEIGCSNIENTTKFYSSVFSWNLSRQGNSAIIHTEEGDQLSGHLNQLGPEDLQNYVTIYIETNSLQADLESIVENGGSIQVKPVDLPDGRKFAWFKDVDGNLLGLITRR